MKPVRLHAGAKAEAQAAALYYESRQPGLGFDFLAEVDAALDRIAASPGRWQRAGHGTRRVNTARFPYTLFYQDTPAAVIVLAVAPQHRRPHYWRSRI